MLGGGVAGDKIVHAADAVLVSQLELEALVEIDADIFCRVVDPDQCYIISAVLHHIEITFMVVIGRQQQAVVQEAQVDAAVEFIRPLPRGVGIGQELGPRRTAFQETVRGAAIVAAQAIVARRARKVFVPDIVAVIIDIGVTGQPIGRTQL